MNNTETINMNAAELITLKYTTEANRIDGGGAGHTGGGGAAGALKASERKEW